MKRPTVASLKRVNAENLKALGAQRLADMLIAAAAGRPELKRHLRMELAAAQGAEHLAVEVDKRLASLETSRSKVSWRQRPSFVRDLEGLRTLIAGRLAEFDSPMALARLWVLMSLARHLDRRVQDRDGELAAVFARAAGDIAALISSRDDASTASALVEAMISQPVAWAAWLPLVLQRTSPELAAAALQRISERGGAARSWIPLIRQLADASGDVDAFRATFDPEALRTPSVAADVAKRLLAAERVEDAGKAMAELTTTSGEVIGFDPAAVTAISDMDPDSGAAVTCVYGIEGSVAQTVDPVSDLLQRLHLTNKVAKLTRPDGSPIWIGAAAVTTLRAPLPDEYAPEVKAVIAVIGVMQGVMETLSEARGAIDAAGGHL